MGDQTKPAWVTRRTVLIAGAGATSLLALMSGRAEAKMAQTAVKYQTTPKDGKQCEQLQPLRRPQRMQVCRGRHLSQRMVRTLGEEGRLTIRPGVDRSPAMTNGHDN